MPSNEKEEKSQFPPHMRFVIAGMAGWVNYEYARPICEASGFRMCYPKDTLLNKSMYNWNFDIINLA